VITTSNIAHAWRQAGSHDQSRTSGIIQENFEHQKDNNAEEVIEKTRREGMELLRKTVRPEFLNLVIYCTHSLISS